MAKKSKKNYLNIINKRFLLLIIIIGKAINQEKNEIKIIINSTISNEIINSKYVKYIYNITVNGIGSNLTTYKNYLSKEIDKLTIIFNNNLYSYEKMFYNLENILYIDLTNIDSKYV